MLLSLILSVIIQANIVDLCSTVVAFCFQAFSRPNTFENKITVCPLFCIKCLYLAIEQYFQSKLFSSAFMCVVDYAVEYGCTRPFEFGGEIFWWCSL